jgi:phosphoribosyl 1,2-cyclic phosphate phosphodiesterase
MHIFTFQMKVTFLGTGTSQGVPVIACNCRVCMSADKKDKRLRSSLLLNPGNGTIVIDSGPDFRQQMLRENIHQLDAVIITHEHKDHLGGLDDIRAFNYFQNKPIDVYARSSILKVVKKEFFYAFSDFRYPGVPEINPIPVRNKPFQIGQVWVRPVEAIHFHLKVFGYRIHDFAYLTDVSEISEKEKKKLSGLKVLVINALRKKIHYSHFNLEQAIQLVEEVKPNVAYLTHISHMMGLHEEIEAELPQHIRLAYDGLTLEV